jgi:hypothetical protein
MLRGLTVAAACTVGLIAPAVAQQPDMDAMQKWMSAKNVTWHIVGKYDGEAAISSDGQGLAHVTDAIEADVTLAWLNDNSIVGTPTIKNAPSVVSAPRDREPKCVAPVLKGEFDYATLDAVTPGLAGGLHFKMTRTFPDVTVSQVCSSTKLARAKKTTNEEELFIPQPTILAMGLADKNISVSPDRKSVVIKNAPGFAGWVWTLTPTPN